MRPNSTAPPALRSLALLAMAGFSIALLAAQFHRHPDVDPARNHLKGHPDCQLCVWSASVKAPPPVPVGLSPAIALVRAPAISEAILVSSRVFTPRRGRAPPLFSSQ